MGSFCFSRRQIKRGLRCGDGVRDNFDSGANTFPYDIRVRKVMGTAVKVVTHRAAMRCGGGHLKSRKWGFWVFGGAPKGS